MGEMAWYIPVLIFVARIGDVSIGTVRTILVIGGRPWISAFLGFFEVIIWVLAVGGVITYLTNVFALLGYACGFAAGVIIGMFIENRLALGFRLVRVVNTDREIMLSDRLRERGFRVTRVDGHGRDGPVEIAFMIVKRRALPALRRRIAEIAPRAFVSVGQVDRPTTASVGIDSRFATRLGNLGTALRK